MDKFELKLLRASHDALAELVCELIRDAHEVHPERWTERRAALERALRAEGIRPGASLLAHDAEHGDALAIAVQKLGLIAAALDGAEGED